MDLSPFISSDPATRRDGWSPARKTCFLERLAQCGNVRAACAAVGLSRETAYSLRRRDALFARGWAAALVLARESCAEVLADRAIDGIAEEVWYRGELMGTKRRYDSRLLLAHLARLDRLVEEAQDAVSDATRFDEILGCIAGAEIPPEIEVEGQPLPLNRKSALAMAEDEARETVGAAWAELAAGNADGELTDEEYDAYRDELHVAAARARAQGGAQWDAWFDTACRTVDAAISDVRTVSDVSGSGEGSP